LFRYSHSASYHVPNTSEGTRKTKDKRVKKDKIIFNCMRSDRSFSSMYNFQK